MLNQKAVQRLRDYGIIGPEEIPTLDTLTQALGKFLENPPEEMQECVNRQGLLDSAEKLYYHLTYDKKEVGEI